MPGANKHRGSSFDEFLKEGMTREGLSKPMMAKRMGTSRSQLDRVLDPANAAVQLDTLIKAARAIGRELKIGFVPVRSGPSSSNS